MTEHHILDYSGVFWVLQNYGELSSGIWPDPVTSESLCVKRSILVAGWMKCCELAAEIGIRVNQCWPDCSLVKEHFGMSGYAALSYNELAKRYRLPNEFIRDRIHRVISFCAAPAAERKLGYRAWFNLHRKERQFRFGEVSPKPLDKLRSTP